MLPKIRQKFFQIEKWQYFKYDYRKAWIEFIDKVIGFIIYSIFFSITFSYIEGLKLFDSIYYFYTTASTVGYGDISPQTIIGKLMFIFGLVGYAIFKLASLGNVFLEAKALKTNLKNIGRLFMPMNDHIILFFNAADVDHNEYIWLSRFIKENLLCHKFQNKDILLVNSGKEQNEDLRIFLEKNHHFESKVSLINGNIYDENLLNQISLKSAAQIYALSANSEDYVSDSIVLDTVERLRELGYTNNIACELIDDKSRARLHSHDVSVIVRPNRSYPEMIIRCAISPGSQHMLEELLSVGGDTIEMFSFPNKKLVWADLLYQLSKNNIGTTTAYFDSNGNLDTNPNGSLEIEVSGILIMVNEIRTKTYAAVETEIQNIVNQI